MNTIHRSILALASGLTSLVAQAPSVATPAAPDARPVDLAICLDTSGSMDGLIDAARQNIWAIVNDLALAEPRPALRVALLTFGNQGHDAARGWVEVQSPFTTDLDMISMKLFALTTNGGDEYVGRVVRTAVDELAWSPGNAALKLIVVAGNESAEQDPEVDFRLACAEAVARDIMVNSIYCGDEADQLASAWREVAARADGAFASIAADGGTIVIETPLDPKLAELGAALNATYVRFGEKGAWFADNQVAQDANAAGANVATAAQRAVCKATSNYSCVSWDLVDALAQGTVELAKVDRAHLPEALQKLTVDELEAHVAAMAQKRKTIQAEIDELRQERDVLVAAEIERRASTEPDAAFEFAVRRSVRAQAEAKGFRFAAPSTVAKK